MLPPAQTQACIPPSGRPRRRSGLTLVEVMFAAAILALVFAGSMTALQSGYQMMDVARHTAIAGQILQSEIENLRLKNWAQLSALPETAPVTIDSSFSEFAGQFSCTRTMTPVRTGLLSTTVTVFWRSYDGIIRSRSFTTQFSQNGLNDYYYRAL